MNAALRKHDVGPMDELKADFQQTNATFKVESIARKALRSLTSVKQWAGALSVSPQQVSQWINGAKIPDRRQKQVVDQAKIYLLDAKELDIEIDRMLSNVFGPGRDPGVF